MIKDSLISIWSIAFCLFTFDFPDAWCIIHVPTRSRAQNESRKPKEMKRMNEHASARLKLAASLVVVLALAAAWLGAHATVAAQDGPAQSNMNQQQPPGQQPQPENPAFAELRKRIAGNENK